ncbi:MAG TPA: hypothetical protein VHO72_11545 [Bacteroidales bacterium]|nr:hypothetical protein [Bacteroidales bacterium]
MVNNLLGNIPVYEKQKSDDFTLSDIKVNHQKNIHLIKNNIYLLNRNQHINYTLSRDTWKYPQSGVIRKCLFLLVFSVFSFTAFSQNFTTKDNHFGYWDNTTTWSTAYPGTTVTAADLIEIYGNVRSTTSLNINKGLLAIHDTLIVDGDLILANNANLTIYDGVLIVRGNFDAKNKVDIAAGGYLVVMSDFSIDGGGSGSFTSTLEPAKVFIYDPTPGFPVNRTDYPVLQCPSSGFDYSGTTCNYGNGTDILSDPINSFIDALNCDNLILYSAGSGNFTDANRWSTISGGIGNYTYSAADPLKHIFVVENGQTVTVNTAVDVAGLIIGRSGAAATLVANANINLYCNSDSIRINTNGNLQLNGNYLRAAGGSNRFSMVGGTLQVNSNITSSLGAFEDIRLTGGTVDYSYNGNQSINDLSYYNLRLSGSGVKTLSDPITVASDINISASATLEIGAADANISVAGNWTNQGTFNTNNRIAYVEFNGNTNNQSITGSTVFHGLRINKAAGLLLNLNDNIRVNSNITFSGDGILVLGTHNLTLSSSITQVNTSGSFSANRMIQLNGTATSGRVIKELQSASGFVFNYPVGTGTLYTPIEVGPLSATITGTASIAVNTVPYTSALTNIVKRYGTIETTGITAYTEAPVRFYYDQSEEFGSPNLIIRMVGSVTNTITDADADLNSNYFGAGSSNTAIDGEWRFVNAAALPVIYYSYNDGNWNDPNTWTTDPSGTTQKGMPVAGPTNIDYVVILNGRTVTMTNNNNTVRSVTINQGGTLDLAATTGHSFGYVYGQGTLRLSSLTIPGTTDFTSFVAPGGGTFEYYNISGQLSGTFLTYNNLVLSGTGTKTIGGTAALTYHMNGNLSVTGGTLTIGNAATILNINGDFNVSAACNVGIPNQNRTHQIFLSGNFTNNGTIRFTNQITPDYATAPNSGMLWITFNSGNRNQTVICNGQTDFYRFIVDKGTDQTYSVSVSASNVNNFRLFGTNDDADSGLGDNNTPVRTVNKALSIQNGTLILGNNISIPCLTTDNNYRINQTAALIIDGASVTASNSGGSCGSQAIVIYGLEQVNSGLLDNACSAGVVIRSTGTFILNGGTVNASQLRPSVTSGDHRGAVIINGGTFNLKPVATLGETKIECARFSVPYASMIFQMTGGTVNIYNPISNGTFGGGLEIGVASDNINVTGGTFNVYIEGDNNFDFTSSAPFYNLNIYRRGTGTGIARIQSLNYNISGTNLNVPAYPLVVLNDFTLNNSIQAPTFNSGNQDVTIRGDFNAMGTSTYLPGTNTTYFDGTRASQVIISGSAINFNNLVANNTNASGVVSLAGGGSVSVAGNLSILSGTFNDGGKTVTVAGNLVNSAVHSGTGRIRLNNAVAAAATIGGSGNGIWGNLQLDDTDGALMMARQTINGTLTLSRGVLDIASNRLAFSATGIISVTSPSSTRMIRTAGLKSDDGISKTLSSANTSFTFPLGTGANYTPATIAVTAGTYGTVNIRPVNQQHPMLTIPPATTNDALRYYWNVNSTDFAGITASSCQFSYVDGLVPLSDNTFISAMYNESAGIWSTQSGVTSASNIFTYTTVTSSLNGEVTAGNPTAFGPVTIYESITTGNWETPATWRRRQGTTIIENPSTSIPGSLNPVIIQSGHKVTVTGTGGAVHAGSLEIQNNAVLDLGTTMSTFDHNFGSIIGEQVTGSGTLRLSSSAAIGRFPAGDFGNFLGPNGGSVVYYRETTDFTLPISSIAPTNLALAAYNNLTIEPNGGTITFPVQNIRIYKDLTTNATAAGANANMSVGANGNIQVDGNLYVSGYSALQYGNGTARSLVVNGNIAIAPNASLKVLNSGTVVNNTLSVGSNFQNNGTLSLLNAGRYVNTTFTGTSHASFTGTGTTSAFNRVILNKGTDTTYSLTVDASAFSLQATSAGTSKALELQNGTFRLSSNQSIVLSSGNNNGSDFEIPLTAQLWIDNGTASVTATGTNAGLFLGGKLKVTGNGVVNIAGGGTNNNYIEYAGVGSPTIEVGGNGQLTVGSQVRRLTTSTNGSLHYIQKGGTVTLGTQSAPTSNRGVLEILNDGSEFRMEAGTLIIARQQTAATMASLYLTPSVSDVTGGTVRLGITGVTSSNLQINSVVPLWNVNVGTTTGTAVTASLSVNELKVLRNLTIENGATLNTNNLNVSIGANFTATGTYTYGTNTTIFNGTVNQQISGAPSFNNLTISNTLAGGTVTLNNDIVINGMLALNTGVLYDNSRLITVKGDISNAGEHRSSGTGRILLDHTGIQTLSGSGSGIFGSIELNNKSGVYLTSNQTINNTLTFTKGLLHIDNHRLTLGNTFKVAGVPSDSAMIKTSGSQGDAGVQLNIISGNFDYLIPFGVIGKYTPVRYSSAANTNTGYIVVKPVNSQLPITSDPLPKELSYYWQVSSSGLVGTILTQDYYYVDLDVIGRGTETNYIGARYYSGSWTTTGVVTPSTNRIRFTDVNFIDGDYTAGEASEFSLTVNTFQTANSGNWETGSTWVGGVVPISNANVIINPSHKVTINTNSKRTYSLYIRDNAELIVGDRTGHNFGITHGTGTLTIGSNIFPGGDYNGLVALDSGTIKYTHNGTIPNTLTSYNNLIIASSGSLSLPSVTPITIRGNLTIQTGTLSATSQRIVLRKNCVVNGTFSQGTSTVELAGSAVQTISAIAPLNFWNVVVNNAAGIKLNNTFTINNALSLTNGIVNLSGTNEAVFAASATYSGASDVSYINGIVRKTSTGTGFTFPVGNGQYRPITFGSFNGEYTVAYNNAAYNPGITTAPITRASDFEYWNVNRIAGTSNPSITMRWTNANQIPVVSALSNLRIAYWNGTAWEETSPTPSVTGNLSSGSITINSFANSGFITFGSSDAPQGYCPSTLNVLYQADNIPTADSYTWTTDAASLVTLTPDTDPRRVYASFISATGGTGNIVLSVRRGATILAVKYYTFRIFPGPVISIIESDSSISLR